MRIAVVALGKIGLPLAVQFAEKGHDVIGIDVNPATVESVNSGVEPFPGEAFLAEKLAAVVSAGLLRSTTNFADGIPGAEAIVVVVPLFVNADGSPEFARLDAATESIAAHLTPGSTVLYETTLPVGTTRNRWVPALERGSGLTAGQDFWVAYSPERVLTGRVFADLRRYPKIVGGIDPDSAKRATAYYEQVLDFDERPDLARPNGVWDVGTAEAAEMVKLAETTYRDVNIGLANQFARYAETAGMDIYQVIEAANSQPYSHIHQPGIAVGGHCIPVYPRLYLWNDPTATVVSAARAANAAMPAHAVDVLARMLGSLQGLRVVVLGAAYRGGVKETAFSGVHDVVRSLIAQGATALVHDPMYDDEELAAEGFAAYHLGDAVDAAIVQADHVEYRDLTPRDLPGVRLVIDGRRHLDASAWTGVPVVTLGIGD